MPGGFLSTYYIAYFQSWLQKHFELNFAQFFKLLLLQKLFKYYWFLTLVAYPKKRMHVSIVM